MCQDGSYTVPILTEDVWNQLNAPMVATHIFCGRLEMVLLLLYI